jgi:CspA family cold shock protein
MQGTVKFFDRDRGFGFISREKGDDLFVHVSNLHPDAGAGLSDGQSVEFEIGQGRKGDEARNVRPI